MLTVYLIQSGEDGPVRVAHCTAAGLVRTQAGNPEPLIVRRIYEADREQLRALHERWAPHHLCRDWFAAAVLGEPPGDLHEIDFDQAAQRRRLADAEEADEAQRAALQLAHYAARGVV